MSETTSKNGKHSGNRAMIWAAVITGVATICGSLLTRSSTTPRASTRAEQQVTFVGRVSTDSGEPIGTASIIATIDQTPGQESRTDSNGQFQIELPAEARSLRLVVDAVGYVQETVQANVHRTGPEEIHLHRALTPKPQVRHNTVIIPQRAGGSPSSATATVTPVPNQGIINNAPNLGVQNNCTAGVVNCDQSLHVTTAPKPPPPVASFQELPLPTDVRGTPSPEHWGEGASRFSPGSTLVISVGGVFQTPSFQIQCVSPCLLKSPRFASTSGGMVRERSVPFLFIKATKDLVHYKFGFSEPLSQGGAVVLTVRSLDDKTPNVVSVVSIPSSDE